MSEIAARGAVVLYATVAELLQDFALFVLCRPGGMLDTWRDATKQGRGFGPATFGGQATLTCS